VVIGDGMKMRPNVPVVFNGKFPKEFINDVDGWNFSEEKLQKNRGKILTLDIDVGGTCSLNCPHCFRRNGCLGKLNLDDMSDLEILGIVKQAKKLGLESVKFLGAAEPFENPMFLDFLEELKKIDVIPLIFTKGHVIGDDNFAKKYFHHKGIENSEQLVRRLKELGARILLGFNSFNTKKQDAMVGNIEGYTIKRNRAFELLVKAGFNKPNPTHMCLAVNPVTRQNYDEIVEIYKWGRVRNLYVVVTPTMVAGRASVLSLQKSITPSKDKLVDLYTEIYKFNVEKGIQTIKDIKENGISSYAGGVPCNQVGCGMYVRLDGIVLRCPGDDITIIGNVRNEPIERIWKRSENLNKWAGNYNYHCPAKDGKIIPNGFYGEVIERLVKKFDKK
jgi:MoaA/NifB/PqqE/SkfB family radical SAM enzyme